MANIIEIKNLTKVYENDGVETQALGGVTFNIRKGEFLAIMGPSGSGKSTLLQILGLLDDYTAGDYSFDGKSIKSYNQDEIALMRNEKMGFVFQKRSQFFSTIYRAVLASSTTIRNH